MAPLHDFIAQIGGQHLAADATEIDLGEPMVLPEFGEPSFTALGRVDMAASGCAAVSFAQLNELFTGAQRCSARF
ncbi:MAG: hypothetical protein IPG91_00750 [Ideonella sp.]|nr:hypothetical protein [Ideonella sp.]